MRGKFRHEPPKAFGSTHHLASWMRRDMDFQIAKKASKHVTRVYANTVATAAGNNLYQLLSISNTPNLDQQATLSLPGQVEESAIISSIQLRVMVSGNAGDIIEALLYKDNAGLLGTQPPSAIFTQNRSLAIEDLRKYTLGYAVGVVNSTSTFANMRIRIRKKALRRIGPMVETDKLDLAVNCQRIGTIFAAGEIRWRSS